jgi:uncharacterized iron-regulated membrane protein
MSDEKDLRTPELKSRRLTQFRRWHKWSGVIAGMFLLGLATTGIILNYKQPIFTALGIPTKRDREASPLPPTSQPVRVEFTTDGIAGGTVTYEQALAIAKKELGDVALERAEIRAERSGVTFRFRNDAGAELWVDAADGRHAAKGEYERVSRSESGGQPALATDWGKLLIDLHTGRIGGSVGKAAISGVAALLLFLCLSGFYLWLKPLLLWRKNAKNQQRRSATSTP